MTEVLVTTWFLEMTDPAQLAPAPEPDRELAVREVELPSPELSRALYTGVGADWYWTDRLGWDWTRWHERLAREEVESSLDGPAALPTYRRRGFAVHDARQELATLPDRPPEPWPGARRPPV